MNLSPVIFAAILPLGLLQVRAASEVPIPLWPGGAPGALGTQETDIPTLTPFLPAPDKASGAAMVILPGGGYGGLAGHEGKDYAEFFNSHGIAGFVVKYRLGSNGYRHPAMLHDAARAIRLVRARASQWNVDPKRVGIIGSSAGGHLASTLLTHFESGNPDATDAIDRESSRPDLGILCYPVITMGPNGHKGSKKNLLGPEPTAELEKLLSSELQVTSQTPPCFIWHTWEDTGVKVENALEFAAALGRSSVPFELHVYERGPHGIGLANGHPWTEACVKWLALREFVKTKSP